jgi:hypothetical protein
MTDRKLVEPNPRSGSGGPEGPEDPTLAKRIAEIEARQAKMDVKLERIDAALQRLEPAIREIGNRFADLNARVAGVEGDLKAMPTFVQLAVMLISTWAAGAAIVFALLKATHP